MKNKRKQREIIIYTLAGGFASFLIGLAGVYENPHFVFRYLLFFFTWLGMTKFITGIFDLVSPLKTNEDSRDAANKAIVKEFFK